MLTSIVNQKVRDDENLKSKRVVPVFIFVLLSSIYGLTYSGTFITDDEHILASRALSYAFDNQVNDFRVFGNSRIFYYSSLPQNYRNFSLNIEPVHMLVSSLLARTSVVTGGGRIQTMFLLNIWVTALTGAAVYIVVSKIGYSSRTSLVSALMFGLCSVAWPYSKTFFRDPLASLLLLISWSALMIYAQPKESFSHHPRRRRKLLAISVFGFLLGMSTKNTILVALPVLAIIPLPKIVDWVKKRKRDGNPRIRRKDAAALIIGSLVAVLLWSLFTSSSGLFARNSLDYYLLALTRITGEQKKHLFEALVGPIISPGKSIFLYSPILLLSLAALAKHWKIAWSAWTYVLLLIIAQALFYDDLWWGSINWGLRFLLPAIPLLVVVASPVIDSMLSNKKGKLALVFLGLISIGIQLVGTMAPLSEYYLVNIDPQFPDSIQQTIWNWKSSAILWHGKWLFNGGEIRMAAARMGLPSLPVLGLLVFSAGTSIRTLVKRSPKGALWQAIFSLLIIASIPLFYSSDPVYSKDDNNLSNVTQTLPLERQGNNMLILHPYASDTWHYAMNWFPNTVKWATMPNLQLINDDGEVLSRRQIADNLPLEALRLTNGLSGQPWNSWLLVEFKDPEELKDLEKAFCGNTYACETMWNDNNGGVFLSTIYE